MFQNIIVASQSAKYIYIHQIKNGNLNASSPILLPKYEKKLEINGGNIVPKNVTLEKAK